MKRLEIFTLFLSAWDGVCTAAISVPREVMGMAGEPFTLSFSYSHRYLDNAKYLCRGAVYEMCWVVVRTDGPTTRGRASISEDNSAHTVSVSVTSLEPEDEGTYWCVISMPLRNVNAPVYVRVLKPTVKTTDPSPTHGTNRPGVITAPHTDVWSSLRWVLFFLMLACPVAVSLWKRSTGRYCLALCPRLCVPFAPNGVISPLLPPPPPGYSSYFRKRLPAESAYQRYHLTDESDSSDQ
ncbi:hypothetical protein SKAU_G00114030 [Synaphobranchus kaupii]|uniref:Immunoglobulin domain-containing protein n=1 Tax=Synaphobranchus kaupii TaxID=118154 RepID=A0A9Q1G0Y0_SYNKA|nr:hypothetical protein SKAU_G00114030 [Synaphobranchus kaupii]